MGQARAYSPALVTSMVAHGLFLAAVTLSWPFLHKPVEPTSEPVAVELIGAISDVAPSVRQPIEESFEEPPLPDENVAEALPDVAALNTSAPPDAIEADLPELKAEPAPTLSSDVAIKMPPPPKPIDTAKLPSLKASPDKPASKGFNLDDIAASVDKAKGGKATTSRPAAGPAQNLTSSELDALKAKMYQCWNPDCGAAGAESYSVRVKVALNRDGGINGAPELMDRARIASGGRAYLSAGERALRAVERCAPYALPGERFEAWRDIIMRFDPKEVCSP